MKIIETGICSVQKGGFVRQYYKTDFHEQDTIFVRAFNESCWMPFDPDSIKIMYKDPEPIYKDY